MALAAILVSLIGFSFETLPALSSDVRQLLWLVEVVAVTIFTIEYALRLIVADSPRRFALSFFGIIDLIAILPFYLSLGVDLRSVGVLRVGRYMQALDMEPQHLGATATGGASSYRHPSDPAKLAIGDPARRQPEPADAQGLVECVVNQAGAHGVFRVDRWP